MSYGRRKILGKRNPIEMEKKRQKGEKTMDESRKHFEKEQEKYAYWLATAEGIGNLTRMKLTEYAGTPEAVYGMNERELHKLMPDGKINKLLAAKKGIEDVEKQWRILKEKKVQFYSVLHPDYPEKLRNIPNAPYGIFVEGNLPESQIPSVAVIGARQCSEYGRYVAAVCGRQLAEAGVNVISGLAKGIDGISQEAALKAGGKSYSVLGCGTNVCYPAVNRSIYEWVKKNGGVISEYPPDTPPKAGLFPMRNRIISGLADIVLIIEARNKSGTLITADLALEQGKEVYVIPGRVTDPLSEGCNRLLKQGAGIMVSITDMLEETGLDQRLQGVFVQNANKGNDADIRRDNYTDKDKDKDISENTEGKRSEESRESKKLWQSLDFYPKNLETLQRETGLEYRQVVYETMKLCISGKARQISAGSYVKNTKTEH